MAEYLAKSFKKITGIGDKAFLAYCKKNDLSPTSKEVRYDFMKNVYDNVITKEELKEIVGKDDLSD